MTQFEALGLSPSVLKSLAALKFSDPTPIQRDAIPLVLQGKDIMGLAQTGTGKTAAFGLPLVHQLHKENLPASPKEARSLILAPTRELANQIADHMRAFTRGSHLKVAVVVGGASIYAQSKNLKRGVDILIATPGRLLDLVDRKAVYLDTVKYLVLDEADQMLDLGFIHSLRQIANLLGTPRQTLLFSATMPRKVEELSRAYLQDPVRIETSPSGRAADKVNQSVHFVPQRDKIDLLKRCLGERPGDLSLVFARTKHGAEKLMKTLVAAGFPAASIHGNKSQGQRDRAIREFKSGKFRILVATDVAARGIDIPGVSHVYNYELPEVAENYVHRIGRTARAGAGGEAVAFCSADEYHLLRAVEKLMKMSVTVESGTLTEDEKRNAGRDAKPRGRGRGRAPGGRSSTGPRGRSARPGGDRASSGRPGGDRKREDRGQRSNDGGNFSPRAEGDKRRKPRHADGQSEGRPHRSEGKFATNDNKNSGDNGTAASTKKKRPHRGKRNHENFLAHGGEKRTEEKRGEAHPDGRSSKKTGKGPGKNAGAAFARSRRPKSNGPRRKPAAA